MLHLALVIVALGASGLDSSPSAPAASEILARVPTAGSLRSWHELLGSEPHVAGTPGDAREIERLRRAFVEMGLEVDVQSIEPLLARPISASLEIVMVPPHAVVSAQPPSGAAGIAPAIAASEPAPVPAPTSSRRGVIGLDLRERNLVEDPSTAHSDLSWGWNAYSASGDVLAPVVYANFGTRQDFALLESSGVDVRGAIVLARYGRNFRGDKVRFAEEAGAAGLVIFSDPADVAKGPAWPEGGWANDTCIQRGSILKKARPGDPLTPDVPATSDAPRIPMEDADLPSIPVQPIGYGAAGRIFAAMAGPPAPEAWQGGLALAYRLAGGDGMRLRLHVAQERLPLPTANVIGTLRGDSDEADEGGEFVVVGCHHDAWGFGAADPLAGTMVLMETAKAFAEAHRRGWRPRRTIHFAAWAAEEFGIIGSTEWCEAHADEIAQRCVAYVNLDMAAMGEKLGASASPLLATLVREAASTVPQARAPSQSAIDAWGEREAGREAIGLVGGGSDHEAFQFRLGVPSVGLFAGGGKGTSYHSNYDTISWYRSVVGEDYEPALMVSRMCVELVRRLADDPVVALDYAQLATFLRRAVDEADAAASAVCAVLPRAALEQTIARFEDARRSAGAEERGAAAERPWLLADSPRWHRHALYGPNADAGYSVETLPLLRAAIRTGHQSAIDEACVRLMEQIDAAGR